MFTTLADYQVVPYAIPDQTGDGALDAVTPFIKLMEDTNLRELLGFLFYDAFIAAIPADYDPEKDYPVNAEVLVGTVIYKSLQTPNIGHPPASSPLFWEAQPANRWTKLLAGEEYTNTLGKTNKWGGMKELCKPMVYAEFLIKFNDYVTSMGVVQAIPENSGRVNAGVRASEMWNNYAKIAAGNLHYISEFNSLHGYLYAVREDFDDVVNGEGYADFEEYLCEAFVHPGDMNIFDL